MTGHAGIAGRCLKHFMAIVNDASDASIAGASQQQPVIVVLPFLEGRQIQGTGLEMQASGAYSTKLCGPTKRSLPTRAAARPNIRGSMPSSSSMRVVRGSIVGCGRE